MLGPSIKVEEHRSLSDGQTLDLHSSVVLDHEEGKTNQIHKCIVSASTVRRYKLSVSNSVLKLESAYVYSA